MGAQVSPPTSPTLLGRLARLPSDQAAWADFAERYGPVIYGWCRRWQLQEADAEDVTQEVLAKVAARMRTFAYDPARSFRGWLKTIAHHAWRDFADGRQRRFAASGDSVVADMLLTVEARDGLLSTFDEEIERDLLDEAMARVQARVHPHTWAAFRRLAIDRRPGAEVAEQLGMKVATAYVARSKVQRLLQEELHRLQGMPDDS